jgi:fucose permease
MDKKTKKQALWTFYYTYALFGISFVAIDPLIPVIAENIDVGFDKIGIALFIGSVFTLIANFLAGRLSDRIDIKKIQVFGLLLLFLGFVLFVFNLKYFLFVIIIIFIRIGFGTLDTAIHTLPAKLFKKDIGKIFLKMDIGWYSGASLGPLLVSVFLFYNLTPKYLFLAIAFIYLISLFITHRFCPSSKQFENDQAGTKENTRSRRAGLSSLKDPVVIVGGILLFFYIGAITGISTWLTTYFLGLGVEVAFGSVILSGYWFFSIIGMIIATRIVSRVGEVNILFYGNLLGTICFVLFALIPNIYIKIAVLPVIAISFAGVFPLTNAIAAERDHKNSGTILGFTIALVFAGPMVFQPVLGYVTEYLGKNNIVFVLLAGTVIGLIFTFILFRLMNWGRDRKSVNA